MTGCLGRGTCPGTRIRFTGDGAVSTSSSVLTIEEMLVMSWLLVTEELSLTRVSLASP